MSLIAYYESFIKYGDGIPLHTHKYKTNHINAPIQNPSIMTSITFMYSCPFIKITAAYAVCFRGLKFFL